jgi:membrane protease YdiL (CAAX protease family)
MRGRIGMGGALVGSALFFTALHFTLDQFIPIFILGLFLAWLYEKTGSLYPGICLHIANNALALVALMIIRATGLVPI